MLWLERDGALPASPYQLRVAELDLATWPFFGIEIHCLPAERVLSGDLSQLPALLALVPFMPGGDQVATLERAVRFIQDRSTQPDETAELATLFAVFAARSLGDAGALALVRRVMMSTEILDQSPLYRRWIAEGRAEGEAKGVRETALAALRGRWPDLSPDVEAAVGVANIETLLDLVTHVAADSQEQMRVRLGL